MSGTPRLALRIERGPSRPADPPGLLWTPDALARWGVSLAVALVLVVGAWFSVSGAARYEDQVVGLAVAVGAVIIAGASGASLLLKGRRAVGLRSIAVLGEPSPRPDAASPGATPTDDPVVVLVGSDSRARYHRSECPMAHGRDYPAATRAQHESQGRLPCGVCRP